MRKREIITGIINNITPTVTQGENLLLEVLLDIRDQQEVIKEALQTLVIAESNKI